MPTPASRSKGKERRPVPAVNIISSPQELDEAEKGRDEKAQTGGKKIG